MFKWILENEKEKIGTKHQEVALASIDKIEENRFEIKKLAKGASWKDRLQMMYRVKMAKIDNKVSDLAQMVCIDQNHSCLS